MVAGGGFALEIIEPLLDHLQKSFPTDLQVMGGDHGLIDFLQQQFFADNFREGRVVLFQKTAFAGNGFDDALAFEFRVGFGDGIAIDAQFLGQRADGRQRFAGAQFSRGRGVADLVGQLEVNRFARLEINLKHHSRLLS